MGYATLSDCVNDLAANNQLKIIDYPVDPFLEMAAIQRRALKKQSPALLFTRPKGCGFPMLANMFGTRERLHFIFRDSLSALEALFRAKANPREIFSHPRRALKFLPALRHARLRATPTRKSGVLAGKCSLADLPKLVSWPGDGGPFITLPLAHSRDPENGGDNLGMYRVQLGGNQYAANEVGMHYQLQRGIGVHHAKAIARGESLPVHIHVGGPPSLAVAAVMPLPEGMSELMFAGILGGRAIRVYHGKEFALPVLADCDFFIEGEITDELKPEGPFGDHLGYYSLRHDFPVLKVKSVWRRPDAIWPFTSVGRPPQEDTVFGDFIHELTAPLVTQVFEGVRQVHAVDAAGVHPLLLAIGSERYTPYEAKRKPRELLTQAMHLLGATQTSLAKFLFIVASEDAPELDARNIREFLRHLLERADFANDLHFMGRTSCDTLDYSGSALHEGSRLVWASAGEKRRELGGELADFPSLPAGFGKPRIVLPGIIAISGTPHNVERGKSDPVLEKIFCPCLENWRKNENFPLIAIVDDADFCAKSLDNFLWTVFTRADPCADSYGARARIMAKHWACEAPFILDGRKKSFHAPVLEEDPGVARRIEALAVAGGPLAGLI